MLRIRSVTLMGDSAAEPMADTTTTFCWEVVSLISCGVMRWLFGTDKTRQDKRGKARTTGGLVQMLLCC